MKVVAWACVASLVFLSACNGNGADGDCDAAKKSDTQCCVRTCDNDEPAEPICVDGKWQCAESDVSREECGTSTHFCLGALPCDPATKSNTECCKDSCNNDVVADPICVDGNWQCAASDVSREDCGSSPRFCMAPIPQSSLTVCVDQDAGVCMGCPAGEVCFTQTSCTVLEDGGTQCTLGGSGAGDDRCHRLCGTAQDCSGDESCLAPTFFGCADFDQPRSICCGADAGC